MLRPRSSSAGFTLLEVILALALSALLLGTLAWAIQLNLKATTSGRSDVARAQLARAALDRMAGDIRSAIWYEPIDPASLVSPPSVASLSGSSSGSGTPSGGPSGNTGNSGNTAANPVQPTTPVGGSSAGGSSAGGAASTGASSGGSRSSTGSSSASAGAGGSRSGGSSGGSSMSSSGGGSMGGGGSGAGGGSSSSGSSSSSSTDPNANLPPPMPGLFGGTNWLQVDLSRLPRPDQYYYGAAGAGGPGTVPGAPTMNRPSEIKSVFYYLAGGSGQALPPALSAGAAGATGGANQGLMRREADRLVTLWQTMGGGGQTTGQASEALAPEIRTLEFRYYNGSSYTNMWDSRQYGCLPRAVEIRITLAEEASADKSPATASRPTAKAAEPVEYRMLVSIPAWKPPNPLLTDPSLSSSTTGSSSSTTGGASAGTGSF